MINSCEVHVLVAEAEAEAERIREEERRKAELLLLQQKANAIEFCETVINDAFRENRSSEILIPIEFFTGNENLLFKFEGFTKWEICKTNRGYRVDRRELKRDKTKALHVDTLVDYLEQNGFDIELEEYDSYQKNKYYSSSRWDTYVKTCRIKVIAKCPITNLQF